MIANGAALECSCAINTVSGCFDLGTGFKKSFEGFDGLWPAVWLEMSMEANNLTSCDDSVWFKTGKQRSLIDRKIRFTAAVLKTPILLKICCNWRHFSLVPCLIWISKWNHVEIPPTVWHISTHSTLSPFHDAWNNWGQLQGLWILSFPQINKNWFSDVRAAWARCFPVSEREHKPCIYYKTGTQSILNTNALV